jgi:hypothetical protein
VTNKCEEKKLINRIIKWGRGRDGLMYWLERELTPNFCP